jgi:putative transposase
MKWNQANDTAVFVSHTGSELVRPVSFRFALDPNREQAGRFSMFAGARRFAFNHHVGRVKANLEQRSQERGAGIAAGEMTASLSWSAQSFITEFNAWKNGRADDSPVIALADSEMGEVVEIRGLAWRAEVSADVFECASVDASRAFKNYTASARGARAGIRVGFPRFQAKHRTTPSFRLRSKSKPGETAPIRFPTSKSILLPRIGEIRIHGCARKVARMLTAGRFHVHSATVSFSKGRWWVSVNGVAAEFHHQRRSPKERHRQPAGLDLGVKSLAIVADTDGNEIRVWEGVKALNAAQTKLAGQQGPGENQTRIRRPSQSTGTTHEGPCPHSPPAPGPRPPHQPLAHHQPDPTHRRGPQRRRHGPPAHPRPSHRRRRPRRPAPPARLQGGLVWLRAPRRRPLVPQLEDLLGLRESEPVLGLGERAYRCEQCGQVIDRNLNAAINLARWPDRPQPDLSLHAAA